MTINKTLFQSVANSHIQEMMAVSKTISDYSKDPRKKVGAVVAINNRMVCSGRNGFPLGFNDSLLYSNTNREEKNLITVHAEANAIAYCARHGISTLGAEMYVTYPPCHDCAKLIVTSGFKSVYYLANDEFKDSNWYESYKLGVAILLFAGVKVYEVDRQNRVYVLSYYNNTDALINATKELSAKNEKSDD